MPTLRSHTHLQAAQANEQTKAYKRVCQPNRTDTTTLVGRATTEKEGQTHNSTYPKGGISSSKDSLVVNGSLVFQIRFCGKSPALRVAANRYQQA